MALQSPVFKPLPLFIAARYLRSKRKNRFASFISLVSILGIALGVGVLIIVLSVMNGFETEVAKHILGLTAHASVFKAGEPMRDWPQVAAGLRHDARVLGVQPFIRGSGMLNHRGQVRGVIFYGIPPDTEREVSDLQRYLGATPLSALNSAAGVPAIFIGRTLAKDLEARVGDTLTLIAPRWDAEQGIGLPVYKRVVVAGVFHAGMHEFDSAFAMLNLPDAAAIFDFGDAVSGLRLRFDDAQRAPEISQALARRAGSEYVFVDWTQYHRNFFHALKSQKRIMFVILSLIVAVAAFNIVASMVMVVKEKSRDIAILRTLGIAPRSVLAVFVSQGVLIGFGGVGCGIVLGTLGADYASALMGLVERLFDIQFIKPDVYYIEYLPTEIRAADVLAVSAAAFFICVVATIYPAWRAAQIAPVEALRYD